MCGFRILLEPALKCPLSLEQRVPPQDFHACCWCWGVSCGGHTKFAIHSQDCWIKQIYNSRDHVSGSKWDWGKPQGNLYSTEEHSNMSVQLTQLCQTNWLSPRGEQAWWVISGFCNSTLDCYLMVKVRGVWENREESWSKGWCCTRRYMKAGFPCPRSLSKPHLHPHCSVSFLMTSTITLCFSKPPVTSPPGHIACSSPSTLKSLP